MTNEDTQQSDAPNIDEPVKMPPIAMLRFTYFGHIDGGPVVELFQFYSPRMPDPDELASLIAQAISANPALQVPNVRYYEVSPLFEMPYEVSIPKIRVMPIGRANGRLEVH